MREIEVVRTRATHPTLVPNRPQDTNPWCARVRFCIIMDIDVPRFLSRYIHICVGPNQNKKYRCRRLEKFWLGGFARDLMNIKWAPWIPRGLAGKKYSEGGRKMETVIVREQKGFLFSRMWVVVIRSDTKIMANSYGFQFWNFYVLRFTVSFATKRAESRRKSSARSRVTVRTAVQVQSMSYFAILVVTVMDLFSIFMLHGVISTRIFSVSKRILNSPLTVEYYLSPKYFSTNGGLLTLLKPCE